MTDKELFKEPDIEFKTEGGWIKTGTINSIIGDDVFVIADGATSSFPIKKNQIIKQIPTRYRDEKVEMIGEVKTTTLFNAIGKAKIALDELWVEFEEHLQTLDYGSEVWWNIVDKQAAIAKLMDIL